MNNKDLIKQYVDTGLQITDYQISKLNKNLLNTYLRKRLTPVNGFTKQLSNYEFDLTNYEQKKQYILKVDFLKENQFMNLDDNLRQLYFDNKISNKLNLQNYEFDFLNDKQKNLYFDIFLSGEKHIDLYQFDRIKNKDLRRAIINNRFMYVMNNIDYKYLDDYEFTSLTPDDRIKYALKKATSKPVGGFFFASHGIPESQFKLLPPEIKRKYAITVAKSVDGAYSYFYSDKFNLLTPEVKKEFLSLLKPLDRDNFRKNPEYIFP